jgi:hypothetical protein
MPRSGASVARGCWCGGNGTYRSDPGCAVSEPSPFCAKTKDPLATVKAPATRTAAAVLARDIGLIRKTPRTQGGERLIRESVPSAASHHSEVFGHLRHRSYESSQLARWISGPKSVRHRRVGKGGRGVTIGHGACSAVPTAALLVGTADPAPRINRYVGAAFAHPTDRVFVSKRPARANATRIPTSGISGDSVLN